MAFRKKTLRTMSPTARKVARLAGELESVANRLKNLIPELQCLDSETSNLYSIIDKGRIIIVSDEITDEMLTLLKKLNPNHKIIPNEIIF